MGELEKSTTALPTTQEAPTLARYDSFKKSFEDIMVHLKTQKKKEAQRKKAEEKHRAKSTMRLLDVRLRQRERALHTLGGKVETQQKWRNAPNSGRQFQSRVLAQNGLNTLDSKQMVSSSLAKQKSINQLPRSYEPPPSGRSAFLMTHNKPRDINEPSEDLLSEFGRKYIKYGQRSLEERNYRIQEEEERQIKYKRHILENRNSQHFRSVMNPRAEVFQSTALDTISARSLWIQPKDELHDKPFRRTGICGQEFSYMQGRIE